MYLITLICAQPIGKVFIENHRYIPSCFAKTESKSLAIFTNRSTLVAEEKRQDVLHLMVAQHQRLY